MDVLDKKIEQEQHLDGTVKGSFCVFVFVCMSLKK